MSKLRKGFRRNQLVLPFGPGAIMSAAGESFMPLDIEKWEHKDPDPSEQLVDKRLSNRLARQHGISTDSIRYFMAPLPEETQDRNGYGFGVPVVRFPRWMYCRGKGCGRFQPYDAWLRDWEGGIRALNLGNDLESKLLSRFDRPECIHCFGRANKNRPASKWVISKKRPLVPVRFAVACPAGHIDDFPWVEWCHRHPNTSRRAEGNGKDCKSNKLYFRTTVGSGLSAIVVSCPECGCSNSLQGAYSKDAFSTDEFRHDCTGARPWLGSSADSCKEHIMTVQVGGSNLHYGQVMRSITIPLDAEEMMRKLQRHWEFLHINSEWSEALLVNPQPPLEGADDWFQGLFTPRVELFEQIVRDNSNALARLAKAFNMPDQQIRKYVRHALLGPEPSAIEAGMDEEQAYRYAEYEFLRERVGSPDRDSLLRVKRCPETEEEKRRVDELCGGLISRINMVVRLREVAAFTGFTRLLPPGVEGTVGPTPNAKATIVPVPDNKSLRWRLGTGGFGEGIFIELDREKVKEWDMREDLVRICGSDRVQILLHTLAHLLLREASFEAGYSLASLKERIYCHWDSSNHEGKMHGILLYTVSSDEDGTLGGLARLARIDRFGNLLHRAVKRAMLCSTDPVCVSSPIPDSKESNGAACHACALLPETSCECFNKGLDRRFVAPGIQGDDIGFFSALCKANASTSNEGMLDRGIS